MHVFCFQLLVMRFLLKRINFVTISRAFLTLNQRSLPFIFPSNGIDSVHNSLIFNEFPNVSKAKRRQSLNNVEQQQQINSFSLHTLFR